MPSTPLRTIWAGVMEEIGLTDVEKTAASCDRWQFNGASFTVDGKEYPVYSYATASTPTEGITAELVYAGKGTMWDYQELDVTGKIVLIDIDQRADWWITYPMLEAEHQGAAAVLAANVGGFAQIATMPSTARTSAALPISPPVH